MDDVEKWLVDQADKFFTGLERDTIRMVATRWHNLPLDERLALIRGRVSDPDRSKGQSERLADLEVTVAHLQAVVEGNAS